MQNRYSRPLLALCCVVLAGELACKDSTAPDANATLVDRVRGTYELSAVLDSHTYTDSCPSPSPSNPMPACHDTTVAVSGRRLHGLVTLADTVDASTFTTSSEDMYFQVPAGALTAINCDTCSSSTSPFPPTIAFVRRDSPTLEVTLAPGAYLILQGPIANDAITGRVEWATYLGCCRADYYTGTFVAKRQP